MVNRLSNPFGRDVRVRRLLFLAIHWEGHEGQARIAIAATRRNSFSPVPLAT